MMDPKIQRIHLYNIVHFIRGVFIIVKQLSLCVKSFD